MLLLSLRAFILLKKTRIVRGSYTSTALLVPLYSKYSDTLSKSNRPYDFNW
jgi:hypothetical protein